MTAPRIEVYEGESPQALSVLIAWFRAGAPMLDAKGEPFQLMGLGDGLPAADLKTCRPVASTMVLLDHGAVIEQERPPCEGEQVYLSGYGDEDDYGERYDDVGEPPGALIGWTREEHGHG